jgi:S-adenosylmethionine decarboxylase proenzyme
MTHIFGSLQGGLDGISLVKDVVPKMEWVVEVLKLTEVKRCFHQFEPHGVTGVILLAESHFSIHTYPEDDKLYFDLFCCKKIDNVKYYAHIIQKAFKAEEKTWESVDRL